MKQLKIKLSFLILAILAGTFYTSAQDKDAAKVQSLIESKNFIFKANFVNPQTGISRTLTSDYDLTIKPGEIVSYLPYFGRAYSAPIGTDGGIKFTSTDFEYTTAKAKKNSWEIAIKPKDASDVQNLYLSVFSNGSATLRVNSLNRQSISYQGYIVAGKEEKKAF